MILKKENILIFLFCFTVFQGFSQSAEDFAKKGYEKYKNKNYKGALVDFNNAIKLTPNDENLYTGRGLIKKHLQDFKGAIGDYNKSISLNPNDGETYCNRGILKLKLMDTKGACLDFKMAEKLGQKRATELLKKFCH